MLYVMDVVFYVCIVARGAVGARVWKYECFVMHMLYVCTRVHLWQFSMLNYA